MKLVMANKIALLVACAYVAEGAQHRPTTVRNLRQKAAHKHQDTKIPFKAVPVNVGSVGDTNDHHRRLKNGGAIFIVSHSDDQGVEWCLDAKEGPYSIPGGDGTLPNVGIRPCCFNSAPTEQLFYPDDYGEAGVKINSAFDPNVCLVASGGGRRVRLGPCDSATEFLLQGKAVGDFGISEVGQIQVKSDTHLCLTYQGNSISDEDYMIVDDCKDKDKFSFSFRTGYYYLDYVNCVAVQDNRATARNRVTFEDCTDSGFGAHWRMDANGRFHTRIDDSFCMQAVGSSVRINPCDENEADQLFTWAAGFEAPVCLQSNPNLCIAPQGNAEEIGDAIVLKSIDDALEYSGDTVHN